MSQTTTQALKNSPTPPVIPMVSKPSSTDDEARLTEQQVNQARALRPLAEAAEKTHKGAKQASEEAKQARLDLGRRLAQIRPTWPDTGPKAGGWQRFLSEAGIELRTAQRYVKAAEAADKVHDSASRTKKTTLVERALKLMKKLSPEEVTNVLQRLEAPPLAA